MEPRRAQSSRNRGAVECGTWLGACPAPALVLVESKDDLDRRLHLNRLVVQHVRAIVPVFDRVGGRGTQDGRTTNYVESGNCARFGNARAEQDGAADVGGFCELGIGGRCFVEQHAFRHSGGDSGDAGNNPHLILSGKNLAGNGVAGLNSAWCEAGRYFLHGRWFLHVT